MALVNIDVTDEEFEEAFQKLEEEERWREANPERYKIIEAVTNAIAYLKQMREELRDK